MADFPSIAHDSDGTLFISYQTFSHTHSTVTFGEQWVNAAWQGAGSESWATGDHDLEIGSDDNIHAVLSTTQIGDPPSALEYAYSAGNGNWTLETVETAFQGGRLELAVDGSQRPHIALVKSNVVTHMVKNGTTWTTESVGNEVTPGSPKIAVRNTTYIAFPTSNGPPRLAMKGATAWVVENVSTATDATGVSLAVAANGTAHVLYSRTGEMVLGTRSAMGVWTNETVATTGGAGCTADCKFSRESSLVLDGGGGLHASFVEFSPAPPTPQYSNPYYVTLYYAHRPANGSWIVEAVDTRFSSSPLVRNDLAVDHQRTVRLAAVRYTQGNPWMFDVLTRTCQ